MSPPVPHILDVSLYVPLEPGAVFPFFADARNLGAITPEWLHFKIETPDPIEMKRGTRIDYRIRLRGIPMRWRTNIAEYDPPRMFVDEQTSGPYRMWRHTHVFQRVGAIGNRPAGTLVRDRVEYLLPRLPPGISHLVHRLIVRPELARIFEYRQRRICELLVPRGAPARSDAPTSRRDRQAAVVA
jgi:ligand-binding SRPBCC domain-containing protein